MIRHLFIYFWYDANRFVFECLNQFLKKPCWQYIENENENENDEDEDDENK